MIKNSFQFFTHRLVGTDLLYKQYEFCLGAFLWSYFANYKEERMKLEVIMKQSLSGLWGLLFWRLRRYWQKNG